MWRKFCGFLLKLFGWKGMLPVVPEKKCIILGAPHTSILDFPVSYLYYASIGGKGRIMVKKEFFKGPVGWILKSIGAIPVDRKNPTALLVSLIHEMEKCDTFHLCLSPEGTRKPMKRWKTGFHLIAKETGIPVYLGYFDWAKKEVSRGERFEISDDAKADVAKIQEIYRSMNLGARHPEKYVTE